jgi:xanthine/uracil/vitamin C permease (AzgA family)
MLKRLETYFEFTRLGTNWRTEILAGVTTFLTMAYIVLVNPAILSATGMPLAAVTAATCLSAAFGSILMGIVARYPIALAPGMGLNAYFTYAVCIKLHIPWQTALGAVFLRRHLSFAHRRRHPPDDSASHSPRALRSRGQRHRPVHRLRRLPQRGPGGGRP